MKKKKKWENERHNIMSTPSLDLAVLGEHCFIVSRSNIQSDQERRSKVWTGGDQGVGYEGFFLFYKYLDLPRHIQLHC